VLRKRYQVFFFRARLESVTIKRRLLRTVPPISTMPSIFAIRPYPSGGELQLRHARKTAGNILCLCDLVAGIGECVPAGTFCFLDFDMSSGGN
jgi:hypothetical protein